MFKRLVHPVEQRDGELLATHWAPCPTTGEPILWAMIEVEDD